MEILISSKGGDKICYNGYFYFKIYCIYKILYINILLYKILYVTCIDFYFYGIF